MNPDEKHEYRHGDIVMAYGSGASDPVVWIGVIESFAKNSPRVRFWNPRRNMLASTTLVMNPTGLTFIGHVPEWAEWDV